jgi:hypothetical protein
MTIDDHILKKVKKMKYFTKVGQNSWHVQSVKGQYMESFFVSIVPPGGTIVMTGDYDGLIVNPYCADAKEAVCWMTNVTDLSYFAQKVGLGNQYHQKTEYSAEKAAEELADRICGYFDIESLNEYITDIIINNKDDRQELETKLLEIDGFDVGANIEKIKDALDCILDNGFENIIDFHEVCADLDRIHILDTWELNPEVYTPQLKWQHQLLLWWAKNVIDKQDVGYFEVS